MAYSRDQEEALKQEVKQFIMETEYKPNPADYNLLTVIGHGCMNTATISLTRHRSTNDYIAIRKVNLDECAVDLQFLEYEIVMTQQLRHENLVTYLCSFVYDQELFLIMKLYAFGSCRDLIHAHFTQGLPEMAIAFILKGVLQALEYLHDHAIIHRSVKASHILISSNGNVVLSGLRHCYQMIRGGVLLPVVHDYPADIESLVWYSPELLEQNLSGYNCRSDIYSLGITGCELGNGIAPFSDMPTTQMLYEKMSGCRARLLDSTTLANINLSQELDNTGNQATSGEENGKTSNVCDDATAFYQCRTFSHHFHHLVETCLEHDPRSRPSASQLLQHTFFKQTRKRTPDQLPELLQPVSPLTDIADKLSKDTGQVEQVTKQISVASIHSEWDFGDLER